MGSSVYHILAEAICLIQDVAASLVVLPIWPSIVQTRWQTVRACEYRLAIVRWGSAAVLRACCAVVGAKKRFLDPHVEFNFRLFRICFFSWCFFLLLRSRLPPESLLCLRNWFTVRPCTLASFFFPRHCLFPNA